MKTKLMMVVVTLTLSLAACKNFNQSLDRLVTGKSGSSDELHRPEQRQLSYKCCTPIDAAMAYSCQTLAYYESHPGTQYLPIPVLRGGDVYYPTDCK